MRRPGKRRSLRVLGLGLAVSGLTGAGYLLSREHVFHYTGATPQTVNCITCHVGGGGGGLRDRLFPPTYHSPLSLAVSPDGKWLYATAQASDALLVVDLKKRALAGAVTVGNRPHGLALDADGRTAYVTNQWSNSVSVVDLRSRTVVRDLPVGHQPKGVALVQDKTLYVANWQSHDISVIDTESGKEILRLPGGSNPNQLALSPDSSLLAVSNELSFPSRSGDAPVSEVTLIDPRSRRVVLRHRLHDAHLLEGITVVPQADLALVALVRPKNLIPIIQVARGWVMTNGLGVIDLEKGRTYQLLLDEPNRHFADPYGMAVTGQGRYLFVTHSGVDQVSVVDLSELRSVLERINPDRTEAFANHLGLSSRFVVKRIATGANPKGMVLSPQGDLLYVAERLDDSILAIDLKELEPAFRIHLGTSYQTAVRRGEKLFNSASHTFEGQFSCRSCHPDNHVDRLQYDFEPDGLGRNILDNRTLLGIRYTAPFKWNGKNTSLYMQCGIRFARILTRQEPFSAGDLAALVAFLRSLEQPPNPYRPPDGVLTPSQQQGKYFFERTGLKNGQVLREKDRCISCHPPPFFTNRRTEYVGTGGQWGEEEAFDTPQLNNIVNSAPYLHDGRARTLEEIWTIYNPDDSHGVTSDMSKKDLNDLIQYLKTL